MTMLNNHMFLIWCLSTIVIERSVSLLGGPRALYITMYPLLAPYNAMAVARLSLLWGSPAGVGSLTEHQSRCWPPGSRLVTNR